MSRKKPDRRDEDLRKVMALPEGRRLLYDSFIVQLETSARALDSHTTYYNLGKEDLARDLLDRIKTADPKGYVLMLHEANEEALRKQDEADAKAKEEQDAS